MPSDEILKAVFPLLEGTDLAACMSVCKQWQNIAQDDYFWKCICAKKWPSTCNNTSPPPIPYHKLFKTFHKPKTNKTLLPPKLSFHNLDFYIDLHADSNLLFSKVVRGTSLLKNKWTPPVDPHVQGPEYKLSLQVDPRFLIPYLQTVTVSVLVARKDTKKVASVVQDAVFDYIERSSCRALAFDYLRLSPMYPFVSGIRAWIGLLFEDGDDGDGDIDVFGIEMDFCDVANSEDEVLWLLDMLDWK